MKMSRHTTERIKKIAEASDRATTEAEMTQVVADIDKLSWAELRKLLKVLDTRDRDKDVMPWLLTALVNIETDEDVKYFREQSPTETSFEKNDNILRLRDELREVWGKPESEVEPAVTRWFNEVSLDQPRRWLVFHPLNYIRPAANLPGSLARAMFLFHEYCFTCTNPACKGTRFVASRKDQKYCLLTEECAKYGHRAAALRHYRKQAKTTSRKSRKGRIQ